MNVYTTVVLTNDLAGPRALRDAAGTRRIKMQLIREERAALLAELDTPEAAKMYSAQHRDAERARIRAEAVAEMTCLHADAARARRGLALLADHWSSPNQMSLAANAPDNGDVQTAILRELVAARLRDTIRTAADAELPSLIARVATENDLATLDLLRREVPRRTINDVLLNATVKVALGNALDSVAIPNQQAAVELLAQAERDLDVAEAILDEARTGKVSSTLNYSDWQERHEARKVQEQAAQDKAA